MSYVSWNRRRWLAATGAAGGVGLIAALAPHIAGAAANKSARGWDVIGVGAGTSGMMLAIFAAQRGARVLLLDIAEHMGGSLHVSTGQMSAAGTRLQKSKGIIDTPQEHYDDLQRITRGSIDPVLARKTVWNAAATFDWLIDHGLEVLPDHPVDGQAHEPYSKPRYYWGPQGGRSILKVLTSELDVHLRSGRVRVLLRHDVTDLLQDRRGAVTGVQARDERGVPHSFFGRSVVLTTGGYCANSPMYARFSGGRPQYIRMAYDRSQGRGIELAEAAGGWLRGAQNYMANFGLVLASDDYPAPLFARPIHHPQERQPWEISVNAEGRRFLREDIPSVDAREQALLRQSGTRRWIVFDSAILAAAPPLLTGFAREKIAAQFGVHPWFHRADDLAALAGLAGIDAAGLANTVEMYNYGVRTGNDLFGRVHKPLPLQQAPFFAIRAQGTSITGAVGVGVDETLRVTRASGAPIANLFACGEILGAGQTQGKAFAGGMMVTPALTFARLLGQNGLPIKGSSA
jgi:fumarate reductase flavoprotein subunit